MTAAEMKALGALEDRIRRCRPDERVELTILLVAFVSAIYADRKRRSRVVATEPGPAGRVKDGEATAGGGA